MDATAILSSKYQIFIPKTVRETRHWETGQEFVFIPKGAGVLLIPVPEFDELAGAQKAPIKKAIAKAASDAGDDCTSRDLVPTRLGSPSRKPGVDYFQTRQLKRSGITCRDHEPMRGGCRSKIAIGSSDRDTIGTRLRHDPRIVLRLREIERQDTSGK